MHKTGNLLWGLILVVIGVIFGLNALNISQINVFFDGWWTAFIIIPCFIGLFKDSDKTGSLIGLIIGVCLLLACQGVLDFGLIWKLMVPVILVVLGLSIIFKDALAGKITKEVSKLNKNDQKEYCATFSGQTIDFSKEQFDGCSLSAVFGGVKCDLKDAIIKEDVVITASAIFGGITIFVPNDVNIKVTQTPIFGGVSDERKEKTKDAKVTIYINATAMFGGVEIK